MPWTKIIDKIDLEDTTRKEGLRSITYRDAIREAQEQLLKDDERVFILGEGVNDPDAIFGTTAGLTDKFGRDRIIDIPIAENGMTGVAIGAAIAGMKPIFVHMRTDFLLMCMDQIVNHAAKWNYMTGGKTHVPLVIRSIIGRGWGSAAQHSQALHPLFMNIPGLKIVMPSIPYDAKGLLAASIDDGNPIMFFEHRWLYNRIGFVPEARYTVPIGKAMIRKKGRDVTVVAISHMIYEAIDAAKRLETEGIDIEIIDPRTIKPLDEELIFTSIKKTGRLVIADVASKTCGVGAEIACRVSESAIKYLKSPIKRVNFPDVPTPSSPVLEEAFYPDAITIVNSVKEAITHTFTS